MEKEIEVCEEAMQEAEKYIDTCNQYKSLFENLGFEHGYYSEPAVKWTHKGKAEQLPIEVEKAKVYLLGADAYKVEKVYVTPEKAIWTEEFNGNIFIKVYEKDITKEMQTLAEFADYLLRKYAYNKTLKEAYQSTLACRAYMR